MPKTSICQSRSSITSEQFSILCFDKSPSLPRRELGLCISSSPQSNRKQNPFLASVNKPTSSLGNLLPHCQYPKPWNRLLHTTLNINDFICPHLVSSSKKHPHVYSISPLAPSRNLGSTRKLPRSISYAQDSFRPAANAIQGRNGSS